MSWPKADAPAIDVERWAGAWMVVLSALCFSAKAIFAKLAYRYGVDPSTVLTLRMACALPFFAGVVWRARRADARLSARDHGQLFLLGAAGYYLASLFDFLGLAYVSASLERLILFLYPTIVIAMRASFHRERASWRLLGALLMSYGGVALVVWRDRVSEGPQVWLGSGLVFAGAVAYAFYLSFSPRLIERYGSLRVTRHVLVVACVCVLVQFALEREWSRLVQPWQVYALAAATGLVATVLPAFLLAAGVRRLGASRASLLGSVGPVATLLLAHWVLGEPLTSLALVGSALVLAGVLLVTVDPSSAGAQEAARASSD
jgi:drug/metabolite transporter (DMT)-like permease